MVRLRDVLEACDTLVDVGGGGLLLMMGSLVQNIDVQCSKSILLYFYDITSFQKQLKLDKILENYQCFIGDRSDTELVTQGQTTIIILFILLMMYNWIPFHVIFCSWAALTHSHCFDWYDRISLFEKSLRTFTTLIDLIEIRTFATITLYSDRDKSWQICSMVSQGKYVKTSPGQCIISHVNNGGETWPFSIRSKKTAKSLFVATLTASTSIPSISLKSTASPPMTTRGDGGGGV